MRPSTASTGLYGRYGQRKDAAMSNGAHAILYSDDADGTRHPGPPHISAELRGVSGLARYLPADSVLPDR